VTDGRGTPRQDRRRPPLRNNLRRGAFDRVARTLVSIYLRVPPHLPTDIIFRYITIRLCLRVLVVFIRTRCANERGAARVVPMTRIRRLPRAYTISLLRISYEDRAVFRTLETVRQNVRTGAL